MTKGMAAALAVGLGGFAAPAAHARDMDGRFGVGLEQNLAGATGLAFRYFTSDTVALLATLGVDMAIVDGNVSAGVVGSAGFALHIARGQHAHLWTGLRGTLAYRSLDAFQIIDPTATSSDLHFALEVPLGLEIWLADNFSVGAMTGILFNVVPSSGAQLHGDGAGTSAPAGAIGIGIGAGSVSATLSVLYYF